MGKPKISTQRSLGRLSREVKVPSGKPAGRRYLPTIGTEVLLSLALLMWAFPLTALGAPVTSPDLQGWSESGWYITSTASYGGRPENDDAYILFKGPYVQQTECLEVFDRLYSPIGICRFLITKPPAFRG